MAKLQVDCNSIVDWFKRNDLDLNASKTELIVHSNKKNKRIALQQTIQINCHMIKCSEQVKSLGLIKDQLLLWDIHTNYLMKKANKSLWKLRCLKPVLTQPQLKLAIEMLFLTQIYYMCAVWGDAAKKHLKILNKIIRNAV